MKQRFKIVENYIESDVEYFVGLGYNLAFAQVLSSRGVTAKNYNDFFNVSLNSFFDPFLMPNMDKAVELLKDTFSQNRSILIFGDYDADGLSASAVLSLFFKHNGIEHDILIPTRAEGYGINVDKVLDAFKKRHFDIVLTVDCGIGNAKEISLLKQKLGENVQFIVTDHHELPDILPDCICVNPKMGYPFPMLSGSGVAFKLVEALSDLQTASNYADMAMIGTVADIMPLVDENRALVRLGLSKFSHEGLKTLACASKCNFPLTANDVAMKISPKINAAGRMGDPQTALNLLLMETKSDKIQPLVDDLISLNEKRREETEQIFELALSKIDILSSKQNRLVFVAGDWNIGLQGIVANRLVEQFNLPSFVMTKSEGKFFGSARGIEGVDIHKLLIDCSKSLDSFGGHKSAAGFSLETTKVEKFKESLVNSLKKLDSDIFHQKSFYDIDLDGSFTIEQLFKFSQTLEPLAPNECLTVRIRDFVKTANTFGTNSNNVSFTLSDGFEVKAFFGFSNLIEPLKSGAEVDILVNLVVDSYSGNICGILRDIELKNSLQFENLYRQTYIENLSFEQMSDNFISIDQAKSLLKSDSVVAVFDSFNDFQKCSQKLDFSDFFETFFALRTVCDKCVVISPFDGFDYSLFKNVVVFCGSNRLFRNYTKNAVLVKFAQNDILEDISVNREVLTLTFKALKLKSRFETAKTAFNKYLLGKISYLQFLASLKILGELGIIEQKSQYDVEILPTEKTDLEQSTLYKKLSSTIYK